MIGKSAPTAARTACTSSTAKRERLARLPPYSSSRWLLPSQKNWSIR